MYARIQTVPLSMLANAPRPTQELMDIIAGNPGFRAGWAMPSAAHPSGTMITLWDTREDAQRTSERTAEKLGLPPLQAPRDEIGRVIEDVAGPSAATTPTSARLVRFDEPRDGDIADLIDRGSRERLTPVVTTSDGVVRLVVIRLDGNRTVSVELAEDTLALARSLRAMLSTELMPYEDPALLTGPTSSDVCAVEASA